MKIPKQLKGVSEILEKHRIDWFLDSGDLLGLMRDGKKLSWDKNELDISLKSPDEKQINELSKDLEKKGFEVRKNKKGKFVRGLSGDPLRNCVYPDKLNLDIHIFYETKKNYVQSAKRKLHKSALWKNFYMLARPPSKYILKPIMRFIGIKFFNRSFTDKLYNTREKMFTSDEATWDIQKN